MEDLELIKKIKLLRDIKPQEEWVILARARLAFRLEMARKQDLLKKDLFALSGLFSFWRVKQPQLAFRPLYGLIIALGVILSGGSFAVWAAQASLPGSPLYPIKIAVEKARIFTSFSDEGRLQVQAEITDNRVQELKAITNNQDSASQKAGLITQVVKNLQDQLATVNQLPKPDASAEPQKAVMAARVVSEKAKQAGQAIADVKNSLSTNSDNNLSNKLAEASEAADQTGLQALETIINSDQVLSEEEQSDLADKINQLIDKTRNQIIVREEKMNAQMALADKLPIRAVLINQNEQAKGLLDKAGELVKNGDFKGAMEMLKAARSIDIGAEKMTQDSVNSSANTGQTVSGADQGSVVTSLPSVSPVK